MRPPGPARRRGRRGLHESRCRGHEARPKSRVRARQGPAAMLTGMAASSGHGGSRHRRRYHREAGDREVVTVAPFHEVVAAIEAIDLEGPWEALRARLRLVLPRRRPLPPGVDDLPRKRYGPGISVGLGLDVGPAILFVGDEQLRGWGVDRDGAFAQAEANLRALAKARTTFALLREPIGGVETLAFQSRDGWAASLLLIPDELCRVLGQRTGLDRRADARPRHVDAGRHRPGVRGVGLRGDGRGRHERARSASARAGRR